QKLAELRQNFEEWNSEPGILNRLARRLSTTLKLDEHLTMLAEEMVQVVPFDALQYRHQLARQEFMFTTGMGGPHRCEYRLNLEGENFGTLSLHRRKRFNKDELHAIEILIGTAICPLRNACQFGAMEQASLTDSLTGIGNKRAMNEALQRAQLLAGRHDETYSLILCDLDHFKAVNDNCGHVIGDIVLKRAAETLESAVRSSDSVYRFGGEEFAVLLPHTDQFAAVDVAERIRSAIAALHIDSGEHSVVVTTSCGVALHRTGEGSAQWLARADEALYRAKEQGRNCTRVFATIS
ncbi:MAG TPA: GGDEF domain-containing protein, partial [Marinobacter sp.]|nr:GGDEF domain-containing protein [Marinobacter sp.]